MIDENFKPWLIEINTNPCLETSSTTLERVIPRMVDNAFKLTLDLLFPPPLNWQNSKKHYMPNRVSNNLFQLVFDEESVGQCHSLSQEVILEMGEI
jgi:tubulin polyglutamylase TTLL1